MPNQPPSNDSPEVLARYRSEVDLADLAARQMVRKVKNVVTLDDLKSFAQEGLLRAARTFDPSRGVPFRRWANVRIKAAMIDGIRQWSALPRRLYKELHGIEAGDLLLEAYDEQDANNPPATPEAADNRLSSYLAGIATAIAVGTLTAAPRHNVDADGREVTPEDLFADAETLDLVKRIVARLPVRERTVIERHYFAGDTLDEAAASLGLSKSWGSRLHARAIELIGAELRSAGEA